MTLHLTKEIISQQIHILQNELKALERRDRAARFGQVSSTHAANIKEYERRLSLGEALDPLVEPVELEQLTGSVVFEAVLDAERKEDVHTSTVRGVDIQFHTPNRRALWQSFGQEYIEPELLTFIDAVPTDGVFFDVGASTGVFALYAAMTGKQTHCFEPEVANFNILNFNAYLNRGPLAGRLSAYNIALSNELAFSTLFVRHFGAAAHEKILGKNSARDGSADFVSDFEQAVLTMSMDEFCQLRGVTPTDVKIDVDGAELSLVHGMNETLKNPCLKRMFIEVSEREPDSQEALAIILDAGFEVQAKTRVQNYFREHNYTLMRKA